MQKSRIDSHIYISQQIWGHRVVDIGCLASKKEHILTAHKAFAKSAREIVGVDKNAGFMDIAKRNWSGPLYECDVCKARDVAGLVKKIGPFEMAVATATIEHVDDAVAFLANIRKFLVPNGVLHLTGPNCLCPSWIGKASQGKALPHPDYVSWYCHMTLKAALRRAGYVILDAKHFSDPIDHRWAERLGLAWQAWMGSMVYVSGLSR